MSRWWSLRFYWRLSRVKCVASGIWVRPPWRERARWTLRWWRREQAEIKRAEASSNPSA